MGKLYKIWMNLRFKLGFINEQGDSIKRLKELHKTCIGINCGNRAEVYNQCHQPERCFCCDHYRKATKTTADDYTWKWAKKPDPDSFLLRFRGGGKKQLERKT